MCKKEEEELKRKANAENLELTNNRRKGQTKVCFYFYFSKKKMNEKRHERYTSQSLPILFFRYSKTDLSGSTVELDRIYAHFINFKDQRII